VSGIGNWPYSYSRNSTSAIPIPALIMVFLDSSLGLGSVDSPWACWNMAFCGCLGLSC